MRNFVFFDTRCVSKTRMQIEVPVNPAIHSFGFDKVVAAVTHFCKTYPSLPLVSVGCGMGVVEREVRTWVKNDFFLVDPAPNSFYPYAKHNIHEMVVIAGMPATHSYTSELLKTNPELAKGDSCLLLLNWCDYGQDDYDLEAIRLLKPRAIFAIIDSTGSAGSFLFHEFAKTRSEYNIQCIYRIRHDKREKYACSHKTIEMKWFIRHTKPIEPYTEIYHCIQSHDDTNAQNIMVLRAREGESPETLYAKKR
jgi:hypothetical protein